MPTIIDVIKKCDSVLRQIGITTDHYYYQAICYSKDTHLLAVEGIYRTEEGNRTWECYVDEENNCLVLSDGTETTKVTQTALNGCLCAAHIAPTVVHKGTVLESHQVSKAQLHNLH
jgi:hypothetical protein